MNGPLEVRRGNKAFSIIAGILFILLSVIAFFNMITNIVNMISYFDYYDYEVMVYQIVSSFLVMPMYIISAIACFVRKKNVFVIVAVAFPLLIWILRMLLSFVTFDGAIGFGTASFIYLLVLLSLIALAILCCIPKIADKCKWTRFIGAVPGALYFICIICESMAYRFALSNVILDIIFYVPAYVLFGLWIASSEKKVAPIQQFGYAPDMQYGTPVQGYYPQYADANYANAPQYQNAPEYQNAPQYSAEQYNGYNQGQN